MTDARGIDPDAVGRRYRADQAAEQELQPDSLVGSFFHSEKDPGWQGVIVAEPSPGVYLIETFSWLTGSPTCQRLARLEQMTDWQFYDDAKWMNDEYNNHLSVTWEQERRAAETLDLHGAGGTVVDTSSRA